jgi:hypothetical protein
MTDIILDTNILADLLAQFYGNDFRINGYFKVEGHLNKDLTKRLNKIIKWHIFNQEDDFPGLIVASSAAFVEIARQFELIANGRFSIVQLAAFIDQSPEWFSISGLDINLFYHLNRIPAQIKLQNGAIKPIEWIDAVHVATAMSRDEPWLLAVTDRRIREIGFLRNKVI